DREQSCEQRTSAQGPTAAPPPRRGTLVGSIWCRGPWSTRPRRRPLTYAVRARRGIARAAPGAIEHEWPTTKQTPQRPNQREPIEWRDLVVVRRIQRSSGRPSGDDLAASGAHAAVAASRWGRAN